MASLEPTLPLGVDYDVFLRVIWAGTIVSTLAVACRFVSRYRSPGRVYWDDAFVLFATVLMIITAALWQWTAKDMYYTIGVRLGISTITSKVWERGYHWATASVVVGVFYYTILLLVKLSFLFFFGRLGQGTHNFKYIWWTVLAFIVISYVVSFADVDYGCLSNPEMDNVLWCSSRSRIDRTAITMEVNCFFDVFSDLLLMSIPTVLLWKVRLPLRRKLAIISILSLSLFTIVFAITRTVMVSSSRQNGSNFDVSWLYLWTAIEPVVAITVCCLSAFPQLFKPSTSSPRSKYHPSEACSRIWGHVRNSSKERSTDWSDAEAAKPDDCNDFQSSECIPPPRIYRASHNTHAYRGASPQMETSELGGIMYKVQFSVSMHEAR